jgi:hypothetical protein
MGPFFYGFLLKIPLYPPCKGELLQLVFNYLLSS